MVVDYLYLAMNSLKQLTTILLTGVSIAYPLIWLFAPQDNPAILLYLPYIMAILWGIKSLQAVGFQRFFCNGHVAYFSHNRHYSIRRNNVLVSRDHQLNDVSYFWQ